MSQSEDIDRLLAQLFRLGVRLEAKGDSLRAFGPKSALDGKLRQEIQDRKAEILATLAARKHSAGSAASASIGTSDRPTNPPLSFAQQRLWFLEQLQPGTSAYNLPLGFTIQGQLEPKALIATLDELIARHEILRTRYVLDEGEAIQVIDEEVQLTVPVLDLRDQVDRERAVIAEIRSAAARPFDLAAEHPVRAAIHRVGDAHWVVLFTLHHIAADGWSLEILLREISTIYPAKLLGTEASLPDLPVQYADFAVWQRSDAHAQTLDQQLRYWRKQLDGHIPRLQLPTDHTRPRSQNFNGDFVEFEIDRHVADRLRQIGKTRGATLYMTLLAALNVQLLRYTGQRDILVGSPIANRQHAEVESLVGLFVNTLVIRSRLDPKDRFETLVDQVRETTLAAYDHQDLPFELLVEALAPDRDPGIHPLFQVKFRLENAPAQRLEMPGLTLERLRQETVSAKLDLSVDVYETDGGLAGAFEYDRDLFDRTTIERMSAQYAALLEVIASQPTAAIGSLSALTEAEITRQQREWNDSTKSYRDDACYHHLFEDQAAAHPDTLAVRFDDGCTHTDLTYDALNARANRLARRLIDEGVGPECVVAICLDRSPEMVVAMLGVLKAGGAYLPLDAEYPAERLEYMIEDAAVQLLVGGGQAPKLSGAKMIDLDRFDWSGDDPGNPDVALSPDNLAYLIYTSGSTGRPKGVTIAHRGLVNLTEDKIRKCDVRHGDCVLQFFSFSFDGSVPEFVMTLATGAHLLMAPAETMLPGPELADLLRRNDVTHITLTPSALTALPSGDYPALRMALVGGEAPSPELIREWSQGRNFINAYGPTETTVNASMVYCGNEHPVEPTILPSANKQLYVLDPDLQITPVGVVGELHIGGVGLARGYHNQPALTAERFIPNPFATGETGEHGIGAPPLLYKSGDLAAYLHDGRIKILGRVDHQTKLRGFRIELGEIERNLEAHPAVRAGVVAIREFGDDRRLVAYAVPKDAPVDPAEIRQFLASKLPHFMLPTTCVWIPELPRTSNDKLDSDALPMPNFTKAERREPRTETEALLVETFASVLALDRVGIDDDFFDLGGHSLLVTRLVALLKNRFDVEVTVMDLFDAPSASSLAQRIEQKQVIGRLVESDVEGADDDREEMAL
ncbi:MAG: non-ribosomal peptide synthetase [Deltaproteobacteria bacterium]|nr:non-ribosomal peptide synthetase [Deltaproteobacteria bacterium]